MSGGDFTVYGDLTLQNGVISVEEGNVTVYGNLIMQAGTLVLGKGTLTVYGDLIIEGGNLPLSQGTVTVSGNTYLKGGTIDGSNGNMTLGGAMYQTGGTFYINASTVSINGNYTIDNSETGTDAYLKMVTPYDCLYVDGDFCMASSNNHANYLNYGTLEVKGNFKQIYNGSKYNFYAASNHNVILSGNKFQTVAFENPVSSCFGNLVLNNTSEEGVEFLSEVVINGELTCNETKLTQTNKNEVNMVLDGDTVVTGSLTLDKYVDLNGYTLTINGDLLQTEGTVYINNGRLVVNGDYRIESSDDGTYAYLKMIKPNDYVYVLGDFYTESSNNHNSYLTNGTIEIKGNFEQAGDSYSFCTYGLHTVVLSGEARQTVSFAAPYSSGFNNLTINNTSEDGIVFLTSTKFMRSFNTNGCVVSDIQYVSGSHTLTNGENVEDFNISGSASLLLSKETNVIENEYTLNGGIIDLNGKTLEINGDLLQKNGTIKINNGKLIVHGNYRIEKADTNANPILSMIKENDYVCVDGDFYSNASPIVSTAINYLSGGILEVKGNFEQAGTFTQTGSHKVLLSGSTVQSVTFATTKHTFNNLELQNISEEGVKFLSEMGCIQNLTSNGCKISGLKYSTGTLRLTQDTVIDYNFELFGTARISLSGYNLTINHDLTIRAGSISLNGGNLIINGTFGMLGGNVYLDDGILTVNGDFIQNMGIVKVNGGRLIVKGDYEIYPTDTSYTYDSMTYLNMTNEKDYVCVEGNFYTKAYYYYSYDTTHTLTNGILEIKGNFEHAVNYYANNFYPTGNHKVILSGTGKQTVKFASINSGFNILELNNTSEEGIEFLSTVYFMPEFTPADSKITNLRYGGTYQLSKDTEIGDYDFSLYDISLDLAGKNLTINHDLIMKSGAIKLNGGTLTVNGDFQQQNGTIVVGGGKLIVNGNYTIENPSGSTYAYLNMTNEKDYVYVEGSFCTKSFYDHSPYLTNGVMEIRGNFEQKTSGNVKNFCASASHKVILNGDNVQTVTFAKQGYSYFNILEINKPIDTGYVFNHTPLWKYLAQTQYSQDENLFVPFDLKITSKSYTELTLEWNINDNDSVVGYYIYRNEK